MSGDLVREHLDKADNWLALAEGNRGELVSLHEGTGTYTEAEDTQRWYFATMMDSAKELAELHRAMAQTIYDLTPQRIVQADWADALNDTETMGKALAEKMQADAEEFDAQTIRPGVDPEPEAEGELWATGDGWFYYAVDRIPPMLPGMVEKPRWLLARHYAQVLRWSSEQGAKPMAFTWAKVGESLTDGEVCGTLRRPTAGERKAFYGPEPDPQPTPQVADLWAFTSREGTALAELSTDELRVLQDTIARHIPVREGRQQPRGGGGAGQWNG